jgi:hypothetical protein
MSIDDAHKSILPQHERGQLMEHHMDRFTAFWLRMPGGLALLFLIVVVGAIIGTVVVSYWAGLLP